MLERANCTIGGGAFVYGYDIIRVYMDIVWIPLYRYTYISLLDVQTQRNTHTHSHTYTHIYAQMCSTSPRARAHETRCRMRRQRNGRRGWWESTSGGGWQLRELFQFISSPGASLSSLFSRDHASLFLALYAFISVLSRFRSRAAVSRCNILLESCHIRASCKGGEHCALAIRNKYI